MAGTIVCNTLNTDTGVFSTNNAYGAIPKAWVVFNGTAATITAAFNVSSISRTGTGLYTVNFATAFADTNYNIVGCFFDASHQGNISTYTVSSPINTGSFSFGCRAMPADAYVDSTGVYLSFYHL